MFLEEVESAQDDKYKRSLSIASNRERGEDKRSNDRGNFGAPEQRYKLAQEGGKKKKKQMYKNELLLIIDRKLVELKALQK